MECYISSILAVGILPRRGRGARSSASLDGRGLLGLGGCRPSLGDAGADGMPPNRWAEMRHRPPRAPRPGRFRDVLARHAAQSPDRRRRQLRGPPDGPLRGALVRVLCSEIRSPGPETAPSPRPGRLPQRHQSYPSRPSIPAAQPSGLRSRDEPSRQWDGTERLPPDRHPNLERPSLPRNERGYVCGRERGGGRIGDLISDEVAARVGCAGEVLRLNEDRKLPLVQPTRPDCVVRPRPKQGVGALVDRVGVVGGRPLRHPGQVRRDRKPDGVIVRELRVEAMARHAGELVLRVGVEVEVIEVVGYLQGELVGGPASVGKHPIQKTKIYVRLQALMNGPHRRVGRRSRPPRRGPQS